MVPRGFSPKAQDDIDKDDETDSNTHICRFHQVFKLGQIFGMTHDLPLHWLNSNRVLFHQLFTAIHPTLHIFHNIYSLDIKRRASQQTGNSPIQNPNQNAFENKLVAPIGVKEHEPVCRRHAKRGHSSQQTKDESTD